MEIAIRPGDPQDLDRLLALLDEIAVWLQSIGVTKQWPASFSLDEGWVSAYREWVGRGDVFLAEEGGCLVGTFRVTDTDRFAWPEAIEGEALYLHTLGVKRTAAGSNIGRVLLDAAAEAALGRGYRELRLDCWDGNARLRRYYQDAGFKYRGDQFIKTEGSLYQERDYVVSRFAREVG